MSDPIESAINAEHSRQEAAWNERMTDPKTVTVQERLRASSVTVCIALCLTMGAFGADYALRHGHGWWLPIVLIVPPLVAILTQLNGGRK